MSTKDPKDTNFRVQILLEYGTVPFGASGRSIEGWAATTLEPIGPKKDQQPIAYGRNPGEALYGLGQMIERSLERKHDA